MAFPKPTRMTVAQRLAKRRRPIGYRSLVRRTNASNSRDLALPKGPTRGEEKAEDHAREVAVIAETRKHLWKRSSRCEICGDTERETAAKWHIAKHQMHEWPSRAMTRGLPPEQRFSPAICLRTCDQCHQAMTANTVRPLALTDDGFEGAYDVQRFDRTTGEWITEFTITRKAPRP